ncbi:MAG: HU family DNA-binding protein [Opitutales bacterium]
MQNLTKREIVHSIYESKEECKQGFVLQNDVKDIVQRTLDVICESLSNGRNVELRNFGVLEVQVRKPRIGRNPTQPEKDVEIPKRAVVKFKAGKELKKALTTLDLSKIEAFKASKTRK